MESITPPLRRALLTALIGVATLLAVPLTAQAAVPNLEIKNSADPLEDVAFQITFDGSVTQEHQLFATIKAAGGQPCAANYAADEGGEDLYYDQTVGPGPYSQAQNKTVYDSGNYVVCAWLSDDYDGASTVVGPVSHPLAVRVPRSSVSISAPNPAPYKQAFQLTFTAQTEVDREIFATWQAPGIPCAANYDADSGSDLLYSQDNTGGPFSYTLNIEPHGAGTYTVCAWVQESYDDTVPEFATQKTVTIPPPPPPPAPTKVSGRAFARGHHTRVTGRVSGAGAGAVAVDIRHSGAWIELGQVGIAPDGGYVADVTAKKGDHLRVRYLGGPGIAASSHKLPVRPARHTTLIAVARKHGRHVTVHGRVRGSSTGKVVIYRRIGRRGHRHFKRIATTRLHKKGRLSKRVHARRHTVLRVSYRGTPTTMPCRRTVVVR